MPLVQGRKRRAQPDPEEEASPESSPEPATQRRRTTNNNASDDEEAFAGDEAGATQGNSNHEQMVKKLVRLALACEYQRRPIRRSDISEKVLGGAGRQFRAVFNQAQLQLRSVFGMEMVELPAREKVTLQQKRSAAQKATTTSKSTSSASYILVSTLPSEYRDPEILPPPAAPTATEDAKYTSIYTLLISLISLSGGNLPEAKLDRYLRRLAIEDATPIDGFEKTEKLLKRLERDGYVLKIKESTGTGEDDVYWTVGPRGKTEVGEDGVRGLTKAVYGDLTDAEDAELERRIGRSLGVGETIVSRRDVPAEKKRRGRKRKDEEEEEDGGGDTEADSE